MLPTDGLWHATIYQLELASSITLALGHNGPRINAFTATNGPPAAYVVWAVFGTMLPLGAAFYTYSRIET